MANPPLIQTQECERAIERAIECHTYWADFYMERKAPAAAAPYLRAVAQLRVHINKVKEKYL